MGTLRYKQSVERWNKKGVLVKGIHCHKLKGIGCHAKVNSSLIPGQKPQVPPTAPPFYSTCGFYEMPKRKFAAFTEPTSTRLLKCDPDQGHNRVQAVIDNGVSSITHALKVARGFERQKLGRRQKVAKEVSDQPDITERLNAEVAALKALDLARTAELHLYKTLLKVKRIANSSALPDRARRVVTTEKASNDIANVNVQARLFNSTPVKTAVGQTLNDVGNTLGIKDIGGHAGKKRLRAKDFEQGADRAASEDTDAERKSEARYINSDQGSVSAETWSGLESDEESLAEQAQVDYDDYESRIAGSDDEATDSQDYNNVSRHSNSDWSGSDDEVEIGPTMSTGEETQGHLHPQRQKQSKPSKSGTDGGGLTATTFLPTLSMGGYWSGGSDNGNDHEDDDIDGLSHEPKRKNKRGQRARQAIYEQKYGQNANHLKKQPQGSTKQGDRDQGWDPRSGARGDGPRKGRRQQDGKDEFGRDASRRKAKQNAIQGNRKQRRAAGKENRVMKSGANNDPVVNLRKRIPAGETNNASKDAKKEALHPSWEAAKKAKETKKAMPFQGKKITFD
ncbi:MAG: hypothetical protein OHK93_000794 [Ramalina farinacea]|uniref:Bud22 domain-containing protein n=1 Tax=Ramalina farinacea TaxID=258253 RepID=A0AA43QN89_9LECA|nr:hypothetical protein [Ramalina farinacea]